MYVVISKVILHLHCLHYSCEAEAAVMLMNAGADVNAKTEKGVTALMIAAAKGHVDVLKVLSQCPTKELWHQVYNTTTN